MHHDAELNNSASKQKETIIHNKIILIRLFNFNSAEVPSSEAIAGLLCVSEVISVKYS